MEIQIDGPQAGTLIGLEEETPSGSLILVTDTNLTFEPYQYMTWQQLIDSVD